MYQFSDFRLLHHFIAIYKQQSLSGAAELLHISQPSLSKSVKLLEQELDTALFERTSRGMIPTPHAEKLYNSVNRIIFELENLKDEFAASGPRERHVVNIGCGIIAWPMLNRILVKYGSINPNLSFNVHVSNARRLLDLMKGDSLDLLVANRRTLSLMDRLETRVLRELPCYYIAHSDHPIFAVPLDERAEQLHKYQFVTYHLLEEMYFGAPTNAPYVMANDHLLLFDYLTRSPGYMNVCEDMLPFAGRFGLIPIFDRPDSSDTIAVAWDPGNPPRYLSDFFNFVASCDSL